MSPDPVQSGHEILVPLYNEDNAILVTAQWRQNFDPKTADYYFVVGDNITTGEQEKIFIAKEFYRPNTKANPDHITNVAELIEGEGYKLNVDSRLQYGQKNTSGSQRFIVYHNKDRRPYQHRFLESAAGSLAAQKAQKFADSLGYGSLAELIIGVGKDFIGDYFHTF